MPLAARTCLALPSTEQAGERGHLRFYPSSPSRLGSRLASVRDRSEHQPGLLPSPDALAVAAQAARLRLELCASDSRCRQACCRPFRWASVEDTAWSWQARKSGAKRSSATLKAVRWSRGPSQLSFRRLFCSPAGPLDRQAWAVRPHRHRTAWIRVGWISQAPWFVASAGRESRGRSPAVGVLRPWRKRARRLGHAKIRNMRAQNRDFARGRSSVAWGGSVEGIDSCCTWRQDRQRHG